MPFDLEHAVADLPPADREAAGLVPFLQVARVCDLRAYRAHLLRLSVDALRARFGILPCAASLDACAQPAANRQMMLLWRDRTVCGAVELHLIGPEFAELAMSLDDALHGFGIGRYMMAGALERAAQLGLRRLIVLCDPANGPMRRLVERCGARITLGDDEVSAWIDVPSALGRWQTRPADPQALPDGELDLRKTPPAVIASTPAVSPSSMSSHDKRQ